VGLRWIQEAHRLWKELSPDGSYYASYCLECEADLLIKLGKFPEAVTALEDLLNAKDYAHQNHPQYAGKVSDRLQECYTAMSRAAAVNGDPQLAESYEESATLQHALKCSLTCAGNQE
jgi:lipopolysaccharide biosynthesis regulator YciM